MIQHLVEKKHNTNLIENKFGREEIYYRFGKT